MVNGLYHADYSKRLSELNLFPLHYRRLRADLLYTWRILRGDLGRELRQFFVVAGESVTRGHKLKLLKPRKARLNHLMTFLTGVVNLWNNLPKEIIHLDNFESLNKRTDAFLLERPKAHCLLDCFSDTSMCPGL